MEKRNFFFVFLALLILSFLIFIFGSAGFLKPVAGVFYNIAKPIGSVLHISQNQKDSDLLVKLGKLSDETRLSNEAKALRDQFDSGGVPTNALLPARVIGAPSFVPGITSAQTYIIDKGQKDGIKKGMAAVLQNNLVGVVSEVSSGFSKITLVTNESFSITAKVGLAIGVVKGEGGSEMVLGNVASSQDLTKNDIVYSKGSVSEKGVGVLPDLIIGRITSVDKKASDLFQKANVQSYLDFSKITHVFLTL
jgi:rod shape-determining protein MreC